MFQGGHTRVITLRMYSLSFRALCIFSSKQQNLLLGEKAKFLYAMIRDKMKENNRREKDLNSYLLLKVKLMFLFLIL